MSVSRRAGASTNRVGTLPRQDVQLSRVAVCRIVLLRLIIRGRETSFIHSGNVYSEKTLLLLFFIRHFHLPSTRITTSSTNTAPGARRAM